MIVPLAFVCGTVRFSPTRNGAVLATVSVAVFDWSPVTVVSRTGQAPASVRTTHDFGRFSTPLFWPHRYFVNHMFSSQSGGAPPWPP